MTDIDANTNSKIMDLSSVVVEGTNENDITDSYADNNDNNDKDICDNDCNNQINSSLSQLLSPSPPPCCGLIVIDNFYNNPRETREWALNNLFVVKGNYPGQRSRSMIGNGVKEIIQRYVEPFGGKITHWDDRPIEGNYNGSFQYTTSRDRSWIHTDANNNWAGVCYLTPNAPVTAGTSIFRYIDGSRYEDDVKQKGSKRLADRDSQDFTRWERVDRIGNIFNRLILFNAKQFHCSDDYFGQCVNDSRLFQVFFFSTEC